MVMMLVLSDCTARSPELRVVVDPEGFDNAQSQRPQLDLEAARKIARLSELARNSGRTSSSDRQVVLRFCAAPERLLGQGRVSGIRLARHALVGDGSAVRTVPTGEFDELNCGLVIRCVGYRGSRFMCLSSGRTFVP